MVIVFPLIVVMPVLRESSGSALPRHAKVWTAAKKTEIAMLELHYWPTPNGRKVTILLEELGVAHKIVPMNIGRGDQFNPDILKFSPNNRMPALVDTAPKGGGAAVRLFESGAIMMYIAEK